MSVLLTGRNPIKTTVTKTETITETIMAYPSSFISDDYAYASISNESNPVGRGVDSTTYATINLTTGSKAVTYVYYDMSALQIPEGVTIESVTCKAKGYVTTVYASYIAVSQMQLFAGTTAKGSAVSLTKSADTHTLDCGTWTRDELQNCKIRLYAERGVSANTTTRSMRFYGAELTVTYSYTSEYEEEVWV